MDEDNEKMDEMREEESFAELFEGSLVKPVQFDAGEKVEARIVKISAEWIFLDLGGKSEGYLDRKELQDEEGNLSVKEGDLIQAYFLSAGASELRFYHPDHRGRGRTLPSGGRMAKRDTRGRGCRERNKGRL